MTLTVDILGPVCVRRDGREIPVPAGRTTELLARLALDAGRTVPADVLLDDLWAGARANPNTLQSKVSQLRRALGDRSLPEAVGTGYRLALPAEAVDALEVARVAARLAPLREAGDLPALIRTCAAGLDLFRGQLLVDCGQPWVEPHRSRLDQIRAVLAEELLAARLDSGETGSLVEPLSTLVDDDPFRERRWALLITALYRAGRQAEALAAYGRVRSLLDRELGLRPGAELRELERRVLQQDSALDGTGAPEPATSGNVAGLVSPLVGRSKELQGVAGCLAGHRLVTLVGTAGVGKTRLALEVARRWSAPGGAWLARLEGARDAQSVTAAVADALGVAAHQLDTRLAGAPALLVLDNCEHVVDDVAPLAARLLARAPSLRILATSQRPLGLDGEQVQSLEPLDTADAVALFTQRAAERGGSVGSDAATTALVERLCRELDRLPLALELAAARTKALPVAEIQRRLADRFAVLRDPEGRGADRHRGLAAAIGWSYDLLLPDDQRGLWALSCFVDGAPLPAVEAVAGALGLPTSIALDVISRLVDRSLARMEPGADPDASVRYRLLDSVRLFAAARLRESGAAEVALRAHADWFASAADTAVAGGRGSAQPVHLRLVGTERANIEAALSWAAEADPAVGLRIANGFGWIWVVLGDGVAGAARIRSALHAVDAAGARVDRHDRCTALLLASWLEASAGNLDRATADVDAAAELAADDVTLAALGRWYRSFVLISGDRPAAALSELEQCTPVFEQADDRWQLAGCRLLLAFARIGTGDLPGAAAECRQALALLDPIGDPWAAAHAEAMLGNLARSEHRYVDAMLYFRAAAAAAATMGFAGAQAHHLSNLGRARQLAGDLDGAEETLVTAADKARAVGDLRLIAVTDVRRGRIARERGRPDQARERIEAALRWFAQSGGGESAQLAECILGALDAELGRPGAIEHLTGVLAAARSAGDREVEVLALDALARTEATAGRPQHAHDLLAQADAVLPLARHLVAASDRVDAAAIRSLEAHRST